MRKLPKRRPRASGLGDATRVGYCPRCRVSTTQRIMSAPITGMEVRRTATCERCGSEIERTILPDLPSADEEYTPAQRRIVDARLAEARKGPYHGPFKTADKAIAFLRKEIRSRKAASSRPT